MAWEEAINYRDVDGLFVTGAAHSLSSRFQAANPFYPAVNDPAYAASGLDAGYLTTSPGVRTGFFYSDPESDPVGSIADEVFKDVVPAVELMSAIPIMGSLATLAIQVPVLIILGSDDLLTCGPNPQGGSFDCSSAAAVLAQEAPYYSPMARMVPHASFPPPAMPSACQ